MGDYRTTLQKVEALREKHSVGLLQAVGVVKRDELRKEIADAETLYELKRVLLDEVFPKLEHGDDY